MIQCIISCLDNISYLFYMSSTMDFVTQSWTRTKDKNLNKERFPGQKCKKTNLLLLDSGPPSLCRFTAAAPLPRFPAAASTGGDKPEHPPRAATICLGLQ